MENTNPNAAGEAAIAPVTPAKKRQAKKLAIIPMLDGYTPIAANTPKITAIADTVTQLPKLHKVLKANGII